MARVTFFAISAGQIEVQLLIFYLVIPYSGHLKSFILYNRLLYYHAFHTEGMPQFNLAGNNSDESH